MPRFNHDGLMYDTDRSRLIGLVTDGLPASTAGTGFCFLHQSARRKDYFLHAAAPDGEPQIHPLDEATAMALIKRNRLAHAIDYADLPPTRLTTVLRDDVRQRADAEGVTVNAYLVRLIEKDVIGAFLDAELITRRFWLDNRHDTAPERRFTTTVLVDKSRGDAVDVCLTVETGEASVLSAFEPAAAVVYAAFLAGTVKPADVRWWVYGSRDLAAVHGTERDVFARVTVQPSVDCPTTFALRSLRHFDYVPPAVGHAWRALHADRRTAP